MGLDSRINAMLMDRIKVYVDARVDEKIAIALENRRVDLVVGGVSAPALDPGQLDAIRNELNTTIENIVMKALRQYRC